MIWGLGLRVALRRAQSKVVAGCVVLVEAAMGRKSKIKMQK